MNRDVERAADRLLEVMEYAFCCQFGEVAADCDVPALKEAATELLDELKRAGIIRRVG